MGGKKALNHARLGALFVSGEKDRLFLRRFLFGISNDGTHSHLKNKSVPIFVIEVGEDPR
ncbi:MAG: hypothetical protein D3920_07940 [Candidatus Electrothrix sp. AW2]|nr:hypothetical protein [Candidatus Electrothrix gigas]